MTGGGREPADRIARRVSANTTSLAVADIICKAMALAFNWRAALHLREAGFGLLSFSIEYVAMFAVLTDLGLGAVVVREIAADRSRAERLAGNALGIKLVAALVAVTAILVAAGAIGYDPRKLLIIAVSSIFIIESAFTAYLDYIFRGFERMEFTALTRVIQSGTLLAGVFVLQRGPAEPIRYALLYSASGVAALAFALTVATRRLVRLRLRFEFREWARMVKSALPVGISLVFVAVYYRIGVVVLERIHGDAAVGTYSVAGKVVQVVTFAGLAFSAALYPLMSRLHVQERARLTRLLETALRYVLILLLPLAVTSALLARPALALFFGDRFAGAAAVLQVLIWWGVLACLNSLISFHLLATNRAWSVALQAGLSLSMTVVGCLFLIPRNGATGMALTMVLAEGVGVVSLYLMHLRGASHVRPMTTAMDLMRILGAAIPATVVALLASGWGLTAGCLGGMLLYGLVLLVDGGVTRKDLELARAMFVARKSGN